MQRRIIYLVFVFVLLSVTPSIGNPGQYESQFLNEDELAALDECLMNLKMDRSDLRFKRDYMDDEYRMDICQRVLEEPVFAPDYSDSLYQFIQEDGLNFEKAMLRAFEDIDYSEFDDPYKPIPVEVIDASETEVYIAWHRTKVQLELISIQERINEIFESATDEDLKFLKEKAPVILYEDLSEGDEETETEDEEDYYEIAERFLEIWKSLDLEELASASIQYGRTIDYFISKTVSPLEKFKQANPRADFNQLDSEMETKYGKIIYGTMGRDVYTERAFLIIDPGGDDLYTFSDEDEIPVMSTIIDLGGDDYYHATSDNAFGAGFMGIGGLFDFKGNDVYSAQSLSLGSGLLGTGILVDYEGDDIYKGDAATMGSGAFGFGYLLDLDGDDHYTAACYAQGFAFTGGMGILADMKGDDTYYAGGKYPDDPRYPDRYLSLSQGFSIGIRPIASGGIGALFDYEGSDSYSTDIYGQAVSYWYSLGILIDGAGDDWYQSHQYNQGSGIHLSTGVLIDHSGDDRYNGRSLSQGNAHDYAVGWLIDRKGNDTYSCTALSLGAANANAVGIFIDDEGNDYYMAGDINQSVGWAGEMREFGGIGIFIDLAGKDFYTADYSDGDSWVKSYWGAGIDRADKVEENQPIL